MDKGESKELVSGRVFTSARFQAGMLRGTAVLGVCALLLTGFCLGLQLLPAEGIAGRLAGRWLVPPRLRPDWDSLLATGTVGKLSNGELADHVLLAGLQRRWFFGTESDAVFRPYVLNPMIIEADGAVAWRRPLWEALWQLVRKETSREGAAMKIRRLLYERVTIRGTAAGGCLAAWTAREGDRSEFEALTVAALRSVGIPSRLDERGKAAWLDAADWRGFADIDEIVAVITAPEGR